MMNINYFEYNSIVLRFEYLLTKARKFGFISDFIEKKISYSEYISSLEKKNIDLFLNVDIDDIFNSMFEDAKNWNETFELDWVNRWIAESYIHLFDKYDVTFELLFTYLPIKKMLELFNIYHEMDVTQLEEYFEEQIRQKNPLKKFMEKKQISSKTLSEMTGISINNISSYKIGRRSLSNMSLEYACAIADALSIKEKSLLIKID